MAKFDETFDFVVVGSGGGSMPAGLLMRKLGKSVVVLEKTQYLGGTTAKSGGTMWIPNNVFEKRDGIEDSYEMAETYLTSVCEGAPNSPGTSPERRRAFVMEAPRMVDFIIEQGVKLDRAKYWPDYYDDRPGGSAPGQWLSGMVKPSKSETPRRRASASTEAQCNDARVNCVVSPRASIASCSSSGASPSSGHGCTSA
jgi:succinate dehydrogenase/fumarate reductase flavoprotein subunit